jgi:taurine---2-oxoglutarate transaminase
MRRWFVEPTGKIPGVVFGPEVNCYRCPLGREYPECGVACADYLAYMIDHEQNVAAVIVEPIVGTNGVLVPPAEYLPRLAALAKKRGVLLIADEVMTGWGRTGKWFAVDHYGVKPDILTTAKGVTNAMVPLGVVATTRAIADHFEDNFFAHGHTYEAHPLTLAPAIAAIDEYRRLDLLNRSTQMGELCGKKLAALKEKHPSVGDVRGLGLFWAMELVKDRKTKEPLAKEVCVRMFQECLKRGLVSMVYNPHFRVNPPLSIDAATAETSIGILDEVFTLVGREGGWR